MAFWDDAIENLIKYNPASAVPYFVGDELDVLGKNAARERQKHFENQLGRQYQAKQNQLNLLGQRKAPEMSDSMKRRLNALEAESAPEPIATDPEFQGLRAKVVSGGRQALAGVQNKQAATGTTGGFSNVGSMQNIYDRLGTQLAEIGQQQNIRKEQKRDTAANARQAFSDAQAEFQNAQIQAQMAIEAGDAAALSAAYDRMYAANSQADQAQKGMFLGLGGAALGGLVGGPQGALIGSSIGGAAAGNPQQPQQSQFTVGQANNMYPSGINKENSFYPPGYTYRGFR